MFLTSCSLLVVVSGYKFIGLGLNSALQLQKQLHHGLPRARLLKANATLASNHVQDIIILDEARNSIRLKTDGLRIGESFFNDYVS